MVKSETWHEVWWVWREEKKILILQSVTRSQETSINGEVRKSIRQPNLDERDTEAFNLNKISNFDANN